MNTESVNVYKTFLVDFDAIIDLCAGFEAYFDKHPDEEYDFPCCNDPRQYKRKRIKSREMFIGKKTEAFSKLLQIMSIELDSAFLEAEYYLTPPNKGKIYEYRNNTYSIAFDFHIDPTAQIETCRIALSYPKDKEEEITSLIRILHNDSRYVVKRIYDGDFKTLDKELKGSEHDLFKLFRKKNRFFDRFHYFKGSTPQLVISIVLVVLSVVLLVISFVSYMKSEIDGGSLASFYDVSGELNLESFLDE